MEDSHLCEKEIFAVIEEPNCVELEVKLDDNMEDEKDPSECENDIRLQGDKRTIFLNDSSLFAVFDGHRGGSASLYASNNFMRVLSCQPHFIRYATTYLKTKGDNSCESECLDLLTKSLREAFLALDDELREMMVTEKAESSCLHLREGFNRSIFSSYSNDAGSTALVVIVTPKWVVCANAGDCRAVLGRDNQEIIQLSQDHKPNNTNEKKRIFFAGGTVRWGRVDGDLSVSRGFGDFSFKNPSLLPEQHKITAVPEICVVRRDDTVDEFLFIGCDGIWDVLNNRDCGKMVRSIFSDGENDIGTTCEEILDLCLQKGSTDNMTALIVQLPVLHIGDGGGVAARREERFVQEEENYANSTSCL